MSTQTDEQRLSKLMKSADFWPYHVDSCEFWTDIEFIKGANRCTSKEAADALRKIADWLIAGRGETQE